MSKVVSSKDSNGITNTLVLQEGDMAILDKLRNKRNGDLPVTITAASAHGDVIMITHKGRIYEFQRKDLFKW